MLCRLQIQFGMVQAQSEYEPAGRPAVDKAVALSDTPDSAAIARDRALVVQVQPAVGREGLECETAKVGPVVGRR